MQCSVTCLIPSWTFPLFPAAQCFINLIPISVSVYDSHTLAVNLWCRTLPSVFWNSKITATPCIKLVSTILWGICCMLRENDLPCLEACWLYLIRVCSTTYQIRALSFQWLPNYWIVDLQRNPGKTVETNNKNYHQRTGVLRFMYCITSH